VPEYEPDQHLLRGDAVVGSGILGLAADAQHISHAIRPHWAVESRLHCSMDVSFNDDQMRAHTKAAAHKSSIARNHCGGRKGRKEPAVLSKTEQAH
jgi:predicted transposase YbfD/YdcC